MTTKKYDPKILIVEDEAVMRRLLKEFLKSNGYKQVDEAENGRKALKLLTENNRFRGIMPTYELIISDWGMPDIDGIELLTRVRKIDDFKNIYFIMLTAHAEMKHILEAQKLGVNDYVRKPYLGDELKFRLIKASQVIQASLPKKK